MVYGGDTVYVFIAMIVLSDADGFIDEHPSTLATRIGKDLETVKTAIANLEAPDPDSSTEDFDGRRIIPMREFTACKKNRGWWVVNKKKYRDDTTRDDRTEYMRDYMRDYRENKKKQNKQQVKSTLAPKNLLDDVNTVNTSVSKVSPYTDTDTDTDITTKENTYGSLKPKRKRKPKIEPTNNQDEFDVTWNAYPGRGESSNPKILALSHWKARLREGHTAAEIHQGVLRYRDYCIAKGDLDTQYVMQAKRFFGREKEFMKAWTKPTNQPRRPSGGVDDYRKARDDDGENDAIEGTAKRIEHDPPTE